MSLLALIRHVPTEWTEVRRLQGRADPELSAGGRATVARWQPPALLKAARWVASPLSRARQTALLIGRLPVAIEPRLIEMDWGAWEGRTIADLRSVEGVEAVDRNPRGRGFCAPGGGKPRGGGGGGRTSIGVAAGSGQD